MARAILKIAILGVALLVMVAPAAAQFGSIFSDGPPRPPRDVPNRPPLNAPPVEPMPPPMNLPPSSRPGGGAIQTQPLAPPATARQTPSQLQAPQPALQQAPLSPQMPLSPLAPPDPATQQATPGRATPTPPPGQRQPRGAPAQQPANVEPQPNDEIVVQPPEQKIANPTAVFSGLDKITGRTISFDVAINETVQFGALQVTPRACYSRPPTETPRTDSFVSVDEVTLQGEVRRIFTGWMFASSPGLHAVEHPIYDIWLTDCKGATPAVAEAPPETAPAPAPKPKAAPARRPPPAPARGPNFLQPFR